MIPVGTASPKRARRVVEVAEQGTASTVAVAGFRVDTHAVHRREVDHHPLVDAAETRAVVAAAAHRDLEPFAACEREGGTHVAASRQRTISAGRLSIIAL